MTRPAHDHRRLESILGRESLVALFPDIVPGPDDLDALAMRVLPAWSGALGDGLSGEAWAGWRRALGDERIYAWLTAGPGGVPAAALRTWLVCAGRAEPEGATWLPVPPDERRGWPAVLLPVWAGGPARACVDLLALDPGAPERWSRRTAFAPLLAAGGLAEFDLAPWREAGRGAAEPGRIRLRRYPLDWLRAGPAPHSYCILDWDSGEARDLLRLIDEGRIAPVCDGDAHAAEIRNRARPKRPKLVVEVAREGAAEEEEAQASGVAG